MPKTKLSAGQEVETLSKAELDASLKEWMVDAVKGIRPVNISTLGHPDGSGNIELGGATTLTGGTLGPAEGFYWAVQRLAVRGDGSPASYSVFRNINSLENLVRDVPAANNGYTNFGATECMLSPGDQLLIKCSGLTPTTGQLTVAGQAVEIPAGLLWRWMVG